MVTYKITMEFDVHIKGQGTKVQPYKFFAVNINHAMRLMLKLHEGKEQFYFMWNGSLVLAKLEKSVHPIYGFSYDWVFVCERNPNVAILAKSTYEAHFTYHLSDTKVTLVK